MSAETGVRIGRKVSGIFGGLSGGLGAFGALHNICHYTCQILVVALAVAGITVRGLPLAFLEDPRLIALFGAMGVVSLFLLSSWSLTQGAIKVVRAATEPASATRTSKEGGVEVEVTLLNLTDPSLKDALVFHLAMNSMDMSAPPFRSSDLKEAITLETESGAVVRPSEVSMSDRGHMGHHLRGRLTFPGKIEGTRVLENSLIRIRIRGIGGVPERVLEWRIPRGAR